MSPHARSKQFHRLWWRTWHRQHARTIRRAERVERAMQVLLPQIQAMLHAWAVAQDGHVEALHRGSVTDYRPDSLGDGDAYQGEM